ncbi:DUF429 domain-containing protein [Salipaludibacillus daqingensis]|uniref:DUF429 domain-containing protein n=1 Tax=Salipaludibacillus daqingensis TaxID=3041001 RepID=UPI002473751F|nr:DUF429 domain-containing protein [Salipaludibacillus daqingensis]
MSVEKVIGIGWDVGGWMGNNHGVAICEWDRQSNKLRWKGRATETSLPDDSLMSIEQLTGTADSSFEFDKLDDDTVVVIGIDAPLGYPVPFNKLIDGGLPDMFKPSKEIYNPLAYRFTDKEIYRVFGKKPLSAVFDRIGNNATLAIFHARHWEREAEFKVYPFKEKDVTDNRIILEVYPALVKEKRFGEVHDHLKQFLPKDTMPGTDAYDACICAIYAVASQTNGAILPKLAEAPKNNDVKKEGWIYYFI